MRLRRILASAFESVKLEGLDMVYHSRTNPGHLKAVAGIKMQ